MSAVETANEWAEFDAYGRRTVRTFWHLGEVLCRIRAKDKGSFLHGLKERGISVAAAYRWIKLHECFSLDAADDYPSLRQALAALMPADEPDLTAGSAGTSPAGEPETAGQKPATAADNAQPWEEVDHAWHREAVSDASAAEDAEPVVGELVSRGPARAAPPPSVSLPAQHEPDDCDAAAAAKGYGRQMRPVSRKHPATWGEQLYPLLARLVWEEIMASPRPISHIWSILDPMAGEGGILDLGHAALLNGSDMTLSVQASDITEWTHRRDAVRCRDATDLDWPDSTFDFVLTSPPYGNRMADKLSRDGDNRATYADRRGHDAGPNDASGLQWGPAYRTLMATILVECWRVLRPGGLLAVDVKDHVRDGRMVPVTEWFLATLLNMGGVFHALRHARSGSVAGVAHATAEHRLGESTVIAVRKPAEQPA